jgi:hypothetical protein
MREGYSYDVRDSEAYRYAAKTEERIRDMLEAQNGPPT